jgi:hypothetical protein
MFKAAKEDLLKQVDSEIARRVEEAAKVPAVYQGKASELKHKVNEAERIYLGTVARANRQLQSELAREAAALVEDMKKTYCEEKEE